MTGAQLSAVVVGLALLAAGAALVVVVRRKGRAVSPELGRRDAVSEDVISGLLAEVRKWQAEAAYWKEQAERLQRGRDTPD